MVWIVSFIPIVPIKWNRGHRSTIMFKPGFFFKPPSYHHFATWPHFFERWMTLSTRQISIQCITQSVSLILIRWIVVYPVDSAIQGLNYRGQNETNCGTFTTDRHLQELTMLIVYDLSSYSKSKAVCILV